MNYYDRYAEKYFVETINLNLTERHDRFLSAFKKKPRNLLDVGCGSCRDTLAFLNMGIEVLPMDNSIELAKVVHRELGIDVLVEDIRSWKSFMVFDAIWACASLLHLSRKEMIETLKNLKTNLTEDGLLYFSVKDVSFKSSESSDDRFFEYYTREELEEILIDLGFNVVDFWINLDERRPTLKWLNFVVSK